MNKESDNKIVLGFTRWYGLPLWYYHIYTN